MEVWAELGLATLHVYLKVFQSAAYGTCCQWVEVKVEEEDVVKHGKRVREGEGEGGEEGAERRRGSERQPGKQSVLKYKAASLNVKSCLWAKWQHGKQVEKLQVPALHRAKKTLKTTTRTTTTTSEKTKAAAAATSRTRKDNARRMARKLRKHQVHRSGELATPQSVGRVA